MTKTSIEAIVAAARELFRVRGYAGASMKDLADSVGLRKGSLYSRIVDKEDLVAKVLDVTFSEIFDGLPDIQPGPDAFGQAIRCLAERLRTDQRCVALHLAYGLSDHESEAWTAVRGFFAKCRERLADLAGVDLPRDLAEELAVDAIARIEGATIWLLMGDSSALDRAVSALSERASALATAALVENSLTARLAEAEDRILTLEAALRGQIEAESCFR